MYVFAWWCRSWHNFATTILKLLYFVRMLSTCGFEACGTYCVIATVKAFSFLHSACLLRVRSTLVFAVASFSNDPPREDVLLIVAKRVRYSRTLMFFVNLMSELDVSGLSIIFDVVLW